MQPGVMLALGAIAEKPMDLSQKFPDFFEAFESEFFDVFEVGSEAEGFVVHVAGDLSVSTRICKWKAGTMQRKEKKPRIDTNKH